MADRRLTRFALTAWLPALCVALFLGTGCETPLPEEAPETLAVEIAGETFDLELALDRESQTQGLSDRTSISLDGGMLFAFPEARPRQFVMRRCFTPIDLIFLSPSCRVVAMHAMPVEDDPHKPEDQLTRYPSRYPAQYAIELAGGSIERLGVRLGEEIPLPQEALKRWSE